MGTQRSTNLPKAVVLNPLHSGLAHCMGSKGGVKSGLDPPAGSRHLFCRTDNIDLLATDRLPACCAEGASLQLPAFNWQEVEEAALLLQPLSRNSSAAVQQVRFRGLGQPDT